MPPPSLATQIETLLRPLAREVIGWTSKEASPDLLADNLTITLCRELTRQLFAPADGPLTNLRDLALEAHVEPANEEIHQYFPWATVSSSFERGVTNFNFLLRLSLLVEDLLARWQAPYSELLSLIFERIVAIVDKETAGTRQRQFGIHFTPHELAQTLTDRTLTKASNSIQGTEPDKLKVIDPCLGGGAFWLASLRWAQKTLKLSSTALQHWPIQRLFGVDVCQLSGEVAILSLRLELRAGLAFHHSMQRQFQCADTLNVVFTEEWPDLWSAVLTNPPWGITSSSSVRETQEDIRGLGASKTHLTEAFVRRILTLSKDGGTFGLILPSKVLEQAAFTSTREALLSHGLMTALDLGKGIFPLITENAALFEGDSRAHTRGVELGFYDGQSNAKETTFHASANLLIRPDKSLRLRSPQSARRNGFPRLSDLASVTDSGIDYSTAEMGRRILYQSDTPDSASDMRALRGRDVHPFEVKPSNSWLRHDWREFREALRKEHPKVKAKVNERVYQRSPKILVRQTSATLIAAIDWHSSAHLRSLLAITTDKLETMQVLLFILNHDWTSSNLQELSHQHGRDFAQIKTSVLKDLPVPDWDDAEVQQLQAMIGQDLTQALVVDEPCRRLAQEWVESLYLRRGYRPKASSEAS